MTINDSSRRIDNDNEGTSDLSSSKCFITRSSNSTIEIRPTTNVPMLNKNMPDSSSSERLIPRCLDSTIKILPTTTDVPLLNKNGRRLKKRHLSNKEFRKVFGMNPKVRVPDECASKFFKLSRELGHKSGEDTIAWLLKQAEPAVVEVIGTNEIKSEAYHFEKRKYGNTRIHQFWKNYNVNHIWALWDEIDGMPRLYARINKIFHMEMKVEVAVLEPQPTTDKEKLWLVGKNLPMACGTFKEATITTIVEISAFSHQVRCGKGVLVKSPVYKISPQKGEIWAVFKDWDVKWTLHDFMSHTRYEMVEVVSDLCESYSITVACLTRVDGFEAVFRTRLHKGLEVHCQFSGKELLRFSHCIPASEWIEKGIPGGSWKLNSAAVPLQLL